MDTSPVNQRETLQRVLLAINTDRPLADDLKSWLITGISRLLSGESASFDDALGWNADPVAERKAQRDEWLRALYAELADNKKAAARIKSGDLPPRLKPMWETAASYAPIPQSDKQITRIIRRKPEKENRNAA